MLTLAFVAVSVNIVVRVLGSRPHVFDDVVYQSQARTSLVASCWILRYLRVWSICS